MKNNDLDFYLAEAIALQRQLWYYADTGVGAACLIVPSTSDVIYDVCRDIGHNYFAHAEHNVIQTYMKVNDAPPPEDTILVTTIVPCSNPNSGWRVGDSCSSLIERYGIKNIYAGFAVEQDCLKRSFNFSVTKDPVLAQTCENLHNLFNIKAPRQEDGSIGRLVTVYKDRGANIFQKVF